MGYPTTNPGFPLYRPHTVWVGLHFHRECTLLAPQPTNEQRPKPENFLTISNSNSRPQPAMFDDTRTRLLAQAGLHLHQTARCKPQMRRCGGFRLWGIAPFRDDVLDFGENQHEM